MCRFKKKSQTAGLQLLAQKVHIPLLSLHLHCICSNQILNMQQSSGGKHRMSYDTVEQAASVCATVKNSRKAGL